MFKTCTSVLNKHLDAQDFSKTTNGRQRNHKSGLKNLANGYNYKVTFDEKDSFLSTGYDWCHQETRSDYVEILCLTNYSPTATETSYDSMSAASKYVNRVNMITALGDIKHTTTHVMSNLRSLPPSIHVLFQNLQVDTNVKRQFIFFNSHVTFGCNEYFSCGGSQKLVPV